MTQTTALIFAVLMYGFLPILAVFGGYKGYKYFNKKQKAIAYKEVPRLWHVREDELPHDIKFKLRQIKEKGEKLRLLYGDTNKDGIIDDEDMISETYVMINKIVDSHIPEALRDYQDLNKLGRHLTSNVKIQNSDVTAEEALLNIISTINTQFDDLLDASYQQDAQKLLVTNRYLKQRFENRTS